MRIIWITFQYTNSVIIPPAYKKCIRIYASTLWVYLGVGVVESFKLRKGPGCALVSRNIWGLIAMGKHQDVHYQFDILTVAYHSRE